MANQYKFSVSTEEINSNRTGIQPANQNVPEPRLETVPSSNQSCEFHFVGLGLPEEIQSDFYSKEQIIVPDELPCVGLQEESKTVLSTVPKIKIKTLEELQNSLVYEKIEQYESYKTPESVDNVSLQYVTALKNYPSTEKVTSNSSCDEILCVEENMCLEPSINRKQTVDKILKFQRKEQLLKERLRKVVEKEKLRKVLEKESSIGIVHRRITKNEYNNTDVLAIENREPVNSIDVSSHPTSIQWTPKVVNCVDNCKLTQTKTVSEFDIAGLKDGIIEASRTLITTQKTLKLLAQMVSSHVYLKDKQTLILLNKFKKTLTIFQKRFDGINKTVRNQYKDVLPQDDIDDVLKVIDESTPLVFLGEKDFENKNRPSEISKLNVPSSTTDKNICQDHKVSSVRNKGKSPKISEDNCNLYENEEIKSSRTSKSPQEKSSRAGRPPKEKSSAGRPRKEKCSRVGRPPKESRYTEEEKFDKTFSIPGSSQLADTALRRVAPARSCRQVQSRYLDEEELEFVPSYD